MLTVIRVTPWQLQKKILLCSSDIPPPSTSFQQLANPSSLGVVAFFFAQYLALVLETFWMCEITYPAWKNVPGSICILPEAVPITQIISKLPRPLVPLSVFIKQRFTATFVSDGILVFTPLMVRDFPTPLVYLARAAPHTPCKFRSSGVSASQRYALDYLGYSPCQS